LRERERSSALPVTDVIVHRPQSARSLYSVSSSRSAVSKISPGRTCFGTRAFRIEQRCGKGGVQLHLKQRASVRPNAGWRAHVRRACRHSSINDRPNHSRS
jgi:hypothetical protein